MTDCEFRAKRMSRHYRQTIDARLEVVFPLLCPVREAEWLDGWRYEMIYSSSGLVEEGAVFSTTDSGEQTVWLVTRHDPSAHLVEFARFTPHSRTCLLRIVVSPCEEERSHVDITYTYTSIAPAGDQFLKGWTEEKFRDAVVFWEKSMNHFFKTGNRLSSQTELHASTNESSTQPASA